MDETAFYFFEVYQTRDGKLLFARIERTVREAVRKAEEAGVLDAEYRIKKYCILRRWTSQRGAARGADEARRRASQLSKRR